MADPQGHALAQALQEWRDSLAETSVISGPEATDKYSISTIGIQQPIPAALIPNSTAEIPAIIRIANKYKQPIYPISTGHNWGYGSANPATDNCVIVDLSRCNHILDMDTERGLVTVEPGVTQAQLHNYLAERQLPYMVPVTGAGPNCSLVGNALERGYGITPIADHFLAVMSLEAILPDGRVYRTPFAELGADTIDKSFKWGIGPYIDGLFPQSSFGVVTQMTIALAPRPECVHGLIFSMKDDAALEQVVTTLREILRTVGMHTSSFNLMNNRRMLSMMESYPSEKAPSGVIIPELEIEAMARRNRIGTWTGVGAVYGPAELSRPVRKIIRRKLKPYVYRLVFISPGTIKIANRVLSGKLGKYASRLQMQTSKYKATLDLLAGKPSEIALPLAYWKSPGGLPSESPLDPARDGCGLIWYSPLVPMRADKVRSYVKMVEDICTEYGIEPLITLTSLSPYCFDSTMPILFNRSDEDETERAQACYQALFAAGKAAGFLPYRIGIQSMESIVDISHPYWQIVGQIKNALDVNSIISPGRYTPVK